VAARRVASFKQRLLAATAEDGLEPYLTLVEELSEEAGVDMAEIAAAAARLATGDRPLHATLEPEPPAGAADGGMVRLFLDAGRQAGVRPADIVGAVAGEADIPGHAIGAIDIYERFAFVEVPAAYAEQVLARMQRVKIRNRPVTVKPATPPAAGASATRWPARKPSRRAAPSPRHRGGKEPGARSAGRPR
jgi:ATP-dependent RNA helicase DeaD